MATAARSGKPDGYHRRMVSNLRRDQAAMSALNVMGIGEAAVVHLGLGLKEPYVRADGRVVERVLSYPLTDGRSRSRFGCIALPGVTANPEHSVAWSAGTAATVRSGTGDAMLIVAASPIAAWRLGLAAGRTCASATVIASSQPNAMPPEWSETRFWARWPRLIILDDLPPTMRERIATAARRPVEMVAASAKPPHGLCRDEEWLSDIIDGVGKFTAPERAAPDDPEGAGDFAADPVAIHGGLSRGMLLYPFRVERRSRSGGPGAPMMHSYETLVLRGDGAILEASVLPAPPGTPVHRRVHALTDGTRILGAPEPSHSPSWSLAGVKAFAAARVDGRDPCSRVASDIMADVHSFISSRVSLPHAGGAWIAAGFVLVSHLFRVFDALPILLVQGPRGSGKSELAGAVAALGFNATMMGQGSAAALVRLASDCGGLVAVDDAECLSAGGGFNDLAQCLKTGYKATTARKPLVGPSGRVEVHDFFGPRVITTTRGVDALLGSRCIEIATHVAVPPGATSVIEPGPLRDELHALAMSRAGEVAAAYGPLALAASSRREEIAAPLLAVADALGCAPLRHALDG